MKKMTLYVQRSTDGQILYFRRKPREFWQMKVDHVNGSQYLFEDLRPGEGKFYEIRPVEASAPVER